MTYERILSYGQIFPLRISCDTGKLVNEISRFSFAQYNPNKPIARKGLSVTSLNGDLNGLDLDSLSGSIYDESSFRTLTDVYYNSEEVRKLVDPFKNHLGRTHFLKILKGGYFPPHRDEFSLEQKSFRIIVPIKAFNPPNHYFIHNDQIINMNEGTAYFVNTNIVHSSFSFSNDNLMLIINVLSSAESYDKLLRSVLSY
jgi:hypothetical protein